MLWISWVERVHQRFKNVRLILTSIRVDRQSQRRNFLKEHKEERAMARKVLVRLEFF